MPQFARPKPGYFIFVILAAVLGSQIAFSTQAHAASGFTLPSAVVASSAAVGAQLRVETLFTSTSAAAGTYVLDTEVHKDGAKVAQWTRTWTVKPGERKRVSQTWDTKGSSAGAYTIKTGVFNTSWSTSYAWRNDAGKVTLNGTSYTPTVKASSSGTSSASGTFYADPSNQATNAAQQLRNSGRYGDAQIVQQLANTPTAIWLGGWSGDTQSVVAQKTSAAASKGQTPVFVAYNIPYRDCGSHSAGGASSADAYRSYINGISQGLANRKAVVIVEPDALPGLDCLGGDQQNERYSLIRYAVDSLSTSNVAVYVDAGNATWKSASVMADRLRRVGVDAASGFALNVAGYGSTSSLAAFGDDLSSKIGGKHYVIDTSRNGNGSNGEWCNPWGRHVGSYPTTNTGRGNVDAYLWIKNPGESDGHCNGGPGAGQYWIDRAIELGR